MKGVKPDWGKYERTGSGVPAAWSSRLWMADGFFVETETRTFAVFKAAYLFPKRGNFVQSCDSGRRAGQCGKKRKRSIRSLVCGSSQTAESADGVPFSRIWREEGEKLKDLPLTREDWEQFFLLGSNLGYLDLAMQERTILLYLEQLDETIKYLKEHSRERSRLYMSLGIMGGLFFTIALF